MALVLQTVLEHGPVSKAQIARLTGLSKSTVATVVQAVNALRAQPLIIERAVLRGSVGRPATELVLDPLAASLLGVAVFTDHLDVVHLSLSGQVTGRRTLPWSVERPLPQALGVALAESVSACIGAGVASPGIVDSKTGRVDLALELGWHRHDVGPHIEEALGLPTVVMNRALAAAYGQSHRTGVANLLYLAVGTDVGAGLVVDGKIVAGYRHQAGEIGHIMVRTVGGHACRCGQQGCLEAEIACGAVLERLKETGTTPSTTCGYEALRMAERSNPRQASVVRGQLMADLALGITLAIRLLDPQAVLLDGHLELLGPGVLSELRALLWHHRLGDGDLPQIQFAGGDPAVGAGLYALEHVGSEVLIYGRPLRAAGGAPLGGRGGTARVPTKRKANAERASALGDWTGRCGG